MVRFVIPAYNEVENVPRLLEALRPIARELAARVLVVDDGSDDGTAQAVLAHAGEMDLTVVRHRDNRGLGTAMNTGIRAALAEADDDDAVVMLEADTTSDLGDLPRMLSLLEEGNDVVLASVYAPGGRILGVKPWRLVASKTVSNTFRVLGGIRELHTLSSLYRVYRTGTLRRAAETYGYLLVREPGFAACVEILLKLRNAGAIVVEVPTVNDWTHRAGQSKMRLWPTVVAYLRLMVAHLVGRIQPPPISPLGHGEVQRIDAPALEPARAHE